MSVIKYILFVFAMIKTTLSFVRVSLHLISLFRTIVIPFIFTYIAFCFLRQSIFVMSAINYSELSYDTPWGNYEYPNWAVAVGWFTAALSAACIPVVAVYKIIVYLIRGKVTDTTQLDFTVNSLLHCWH